MSSIVWLASYPKSGNTWVRAFLQNYLDDGPRPADINALDSYFADESKPNWYAPYADRPLTELSLEEVCALRPRVHQDIAASRPGTLMVKTHNLLGAYDGIPLQDMSVTAGAVYVVRNPLDLVLSVADHFGLEADEAIIFINNEATGSPTDEANMASVLGSWSDHVASWTAGQGGNLHLMRYEDMLDKPAKAFAGLAAFLNLGREPARLKRALEFSSFRSLKAQEQEHGFVERSPNSRRFFRKGRKNQWRGVLSRDQVAAVVAAHREQMRRFKYLPPGF